jgi:hypothetical protein
VFLLNIDLFTEEPYQTVDYRSIENYFEKNYNYVSFSKGDFGIGTSYIVGNSAKEAVKVDLYYTEKFIRPLLEVENIRLASLEDINAMKLDIISRGGRKKDFLGFT